MRAKVKVCCLSCASSVGLSSPPILASPEAKTARRLIIETRLAQPIHPFGSIAESPVSA